MKILIAGSGAVGSILGGSLLRNGHEVVFLARGSNLEALQRNGLRVTFPDSAWELREVRAIPTDAPRESFDAILFCVKGYDRLSAVRELGQFEAPWILTFQNGVVTHHELAGLRSWSVAPSVIYVPADRVEPGAVVSKGNARVVLDGGAQITAALMEALASPEVRVQVSDNIELELWRKYLFLCSFSAINTLTEKPAGAILGDPEVRDLWQRMMLEIAAVARAAGIPLSQSDVDTSMANAARFPPGTSSSLLADTLRRQRTEVDLLQGHLVREAARLGVDAPVSRMAHALLHLKTQF